MVIRYLYIEGIAIPPHEAHAELIVDPDAVLAYAVMMQRPKLVTRGNSQVLQPSGRMEHCQLLLGGAPQIRRRHTLTLACIPESLRVFVREGLDHCN